MKKYLVRTAFHVVLLMLLTTSVSAQWEQTNWTDSNSFFHLYTSQDLCFARIWDTLHGGRAFLTASNGDSWTPISSTDSNIDVLSLAMWNDSILAGTWDGLYQPVVDDPNWLWSVVEANGIPDDTAIWSVTVLNDMLWAGSVGHIYKSSIHDPNVWVDLSVGIPSDARITSIATNGAVLFAGTASHGVLAGTLDGTAWVPVKSGLDNMHISQLVAVDSKMCAVTLQGVFVTDINDVNLIDDFEGSMWVNTAQGGKWLVESSGSYWAIIPNLTMWTEQTFDVNHINCMLVVDEVLLAGTDDSGVYISYDSGLTWVPLGTEMPVNSRIWSLVLSSDHQFILAGSSAGIWRVPVSALAEAELDNETETLIDAGR